MPITSPDDISSLPDEFIGYLSCDPESYSAHVTFANTINAVIDQGPKAIILFSITSASCTLQQLPISFAYRYLYTTINAAQASTLEEGLLSNPQTLEESRIMLNSRANSNTGDTALTKSPTTAVAMIILYSITGVITALFLLIIVVGAIRAHRHPERYGPRNVIGRPRQSRAKGIARAVLETLPIVKFGDKDDDKPAQSREVELESAHQPGHTSSPILHDPSEPIRDRPVSSDAVDQEPEVVKTETAGDHFKPRVEEVGDGNNAENGLACSVCTDDFVRGQSVRVLPCNHKFHPECIDPWLLNVSGTCPLWYVNNNLFQLVPGLTLCSRVDLRPTTTHPSEPASPVSPISPTESPTIYPTSNPTPLPNNNNGSSNAPSLDSSSDNNNASTSNHRRSRTGLTSYIHNTLNRGRMRNATPEERVAALRDLRTANSVREPDAPAVNAEQRSKNRLSARLSRAFNSSSAQPVTGTTPSPDSGVEGSRRPT